jgi:hypothetical protein
MVLRFVGCLRRRLLFILFVLKQVCVKRNVKMKRKKWELWGRVLLGNRRIPDEKKPKVNESNGFSYNV